MHAQALNAWRSQAPAYGRAGGALAVRSLSKHAPAGTHARNADHHLPARTVSVRKTSTAGVAHCGPHSIKVDERTEFGGSDTAPSPLELVSTALASCTADCCLHAARSLSWHLDGVEVDVTLERPHARDEAGVSHKQPDSKLNRFTVAVHLIGPLKHDQRVQILRDMERRSPLFALLSSQSVVATELVEEAGEGSGHHKHSRHSRVVL